MNLFGIDATSSNLSIYAVYKGKIIININKQLKFGASHLVEYIEKSLNKSGFKLDDFDAYVIGAGPGSFTGLRISFSIIKAFAMALNKPVISLSSFYSCAYPFCGTKEKIAVISDARRNLIYFAAYKSKNAKLLRQGKVQLLCLDEVLAKKDYFFVTYDSNLRDKILEIDSNIDFCPEDVYPNARYLLFEAQNYYSRGKFSSVDKLKPLYLHPKTCQVRKVIKK